VACSCVKRQQNVTLGVKSPPTKTLWRFFGVGQTTPPNKKTPTPTQTHNTHPHPCNSDLHFPLHFISVATCVKEAAFFPFSCATVFQVSSPASLFVPAGQTPDPFPTVHWTVFPRLLHQQLCHQNRYFLDSESPSSCCFLYTTTRSPLQPSLLVSLHAFRPTHKGTEVSLLLMIVVRIRP